MRSKLLAALPFMAAALMMPAAVFAQPTEADRADARRHFQTGVQHFQQRDFAHALEEFQSAYRIAPHPSVRKNMAFCMVELQRDAEALDNFEQYLAETPTVPPAERRTIDAQVRRLRGRVAEITVTVSPSDVLGTTATVDGNVVSTSRPVRMTAGTHELRVIADGYTAASQTVTVVAGQPQSLTLTLERIQTAPPPPPPPPPVDTTATPLTSGAEVQTPPVVLPPVVTPDQDQRNGLSPGIFYAVAGVTGAAAIAWGVCGALALSSNSTYEDTQRDVRNRAEGDPMVASLQSRGMEEADRARQWAVWSDVAMGFTLAGAVAGTILFLKTDFGGHRVNVSAAPSARGGTLMLGGTF